MDRLILARRIWLINPSHLRGLISLHLACGASVEEGTESYPPSSLFTHIFVIPTPQRLLGSGARTANGDEADYFYIPLNIRGPSESMQMVKAVEYVRSNWPWWDKNHGARHLIIHTGKREGSGIIHIGGREGVWPPCVCGSHLVVHTCTQTWCAPC